MSKENKKVTKSKNFRYNACWITFKKKTDFPHYNIIPFHKRLRAHIPRLQQQPLRTEQRLKAPNPSSKHQPLKKAGLKA